MPIAAILEPPLTLFFLQLFHTFYHRTDAGFYSVLSLVYNSSETRGSWIFSWHKQRSLEKNRLESWGAMDSGQASLCLVLSSTDLSCAHPGLAWLGTEAFMSWPQTLLWQVTIIIMTQVKENYKEGETGSVNNWRLKLIRANKWAYLE